MAAAADPALEKAHDTLLIAGFEILPDDAYRAITEMEREAEALGAKAVLARP